MSGKPVPNRAPLNANAEARRKAESAALFSVMKTQRASVVSSKAEKRNRTRGAQKNKAIREDMS